jgi:hypothetical protein
MNVVAFSGVKTMMELTLIQCRVCVSMHMDLQSCISLGFIWPFTHPVKNLPNNYLEYMEEHLQVFLQHLQVS